MINSSIIKAIIIDDEKNCRETLLAMLKSYCPQVQVIAECKSVDEGIRMIHAQNPDLLFLDVEMPNATGFDLLEQVGQTDFEVIFTTAHDHYALKAFRYSALDYLLKPIHGEDLVNAVSRFEKKTNKQDSSLQLNLLLSNLKNLKSPVNKIALPASDGLNLVDVQDIIRLEADGNYTNFITAHGKHIVSKSLKEYDDLLSDNNFLRIHQSHLINLNYVKKYVRGDGGHIVMQDGTTLPVSIRKKHDVLEKLSSF